MNKGFLQCVLVCSQAEVAAMRYYIENDEHTFLVDAGFSGKKMESLLAGIDRSMKQA